jgi:hypothetical protein
MSTNNQGRHVRSAGVVLQAVPLLNNFFEGANALAPAFQIQLMHLLRLLAPR